MAIGIAVPLAYLAGSIPFGLLVAKVFLKTDIRKQGSGNIGATNVARVLGIKWGLLVFLLDCAKGVLPTLLLPNLLLDSQHPAFMHLRIVSGILTVVGHMFPIWLRFRGGKGVATALGVVAVIGPVATAVAFVAFLLTFGIWRIVSLSSILAALAYAICVICEGWPQPFSAERWNQSAFAILIPALILLRHRSNIQRLIKGEEGKFQSKSKDVTESKGDVESASKETVSQQD